MENICNDCRQNDSDEDIQNVPTFIKKYNKLIKQPSSGSRPIDFVDGFKKNLYEAILFPETAKGFKFPARIYIFIFILAFQIPTYTFQQKTSFLVKCDASTGNALVQVNLSQYLDAGQFVIGTNSGTAVADIPKSNVFTGTTIANVTTTNVVGGASGNYIASNVMSATAGMFNAVRSG